MSGVVGYNKITLIRTSSPNPRENMPETNAKHARAIGTKLRVERKKQDMSLRELAQKAEISASMLSQIETGKAYPSVRSIYSIAAALSVPVDVFFPEQDSDLELPPGQMTASDLREAQLNQETPIEALQFAPGPDSSPPVVHAEARPTIHLKGGVSWARLTALPEPNAEFLEITYAPGATSGMNMSHHAGREFGLILQGELVVELGFEAYHLQVGDSIIFDSTTPHRLVNQSATPTRALWVVLNPL